MTNIARIFGLMRETVYGSDRRGLALMKLEEPESADPFRMLVGTILSHRAKDEMTTRATENLLSVYRTPELLASASLRRVAELVRPCGFPNRKAKKVVVAAKQLVEEFGGEVPSTMEDLLKLEGVGRKTASCILVYAFDKPAVPVDSHVHREAHRVGLVDTKNADETERELMEKVARERWPHIHDLFVRFGQTICRPVGPKCRACALRGDCAYYLRQRTPGA